MNRCQSRTIWEKNRRITDLIFNLICFCLFFRLVILFLLNQPKKSIKQLNTYKLVQRIKSKRDFRCTFLSSNIKA